MYFSSYENQTFKTSCRVEEGSKKTLILIFVSTKGRRGQYRRLGQIARTQKKEVSDPIRVDSCRIRIQVFMSDPDPGKKGLDPYLV